MQKPRQRQIANLSWPSLEASLPLPQIYKMSKAEINSSVQSQRWWEKQQTDRTVDQERKPCRETSFQGREESDIRCRKGCHPCDNTGTILNQKISMHIAAGGKSSSGCWKPTHGEGKMCLCQKEKPWENLGALVILNLLTHAACCAGFESPASVLALEGNRASDVI